MAFLDFTNMVFSPDDFAHLKIPLQDILSATNNFAEKNVFGRSGIGNSYEGQLFWSGEFIDIRALRLNKDVRDREQRFWMEISMLSSLKHKNLVSLVGFCDDNDEKITIIRRENKGSLSKHLSDSTRLTWVRRLEISVGLANALSYIHYDELRDFSVIHRQITNVIVLLNDNWEPKLSAFDLSMKIKASQRHHSFHTSNKFWGVKGYIDPTYIETKSVNHKSDIYSFGVVLFERLCGYKNDHLAPLAVTLYREKKLINIINPELLKQMDLHSFNMFADIAFECLDNERSRRPNIDDIVPRLEKALELQLKPQNYLENKVLSPEAKEAAATIEQRLELGSKLSDIVKTKTDAHALLDLYKNQGYILTPHNGKVCVILKDVCSPQDMLKSMFHVSYLYWLEKNVGLNSIGISDDCGPGGMLQLSLEYVEREFNHAKRDGELAGWVTDSLIARPKPHRIRPDY